MLIIRATCRDTLSYNGLLAGFTVLQYSRVNLDKKYQKLLRQNIIGF